MTAAAHNKKRRVINTKAAVRKGQQTGANAGNYLAKVGVEGSNPFARSKVLQILPLNFRLLDAAFCAVDDIRSFFANAGARPAAREGRSPGRDHAA
jgi:hypothetical protein